MSKKNTEWRKIKHYLPYEEGLYLVKNKDGEIDVGFWTNTERCRNSWKYEYKKWCKIPE